MRKALCLFKDQFHHIKPVEKTCVGKVEFVYDEIWDEKLISTIKPDIIIGINEHHYKIAKCYETAKKIDIPTLTLQDGVLEWRYLFENPMFSGSDKGIPLHQPILADKYACIGSWWANLIASMGNQQKVEITGMPKLDEIFSQEANFGHKIVHNTILVMTAAKPWFKESQKSIIIKMLKDLKAYFTERRDLKVIWRITKQLDKELGLETSFNQKNSLELIKQLKDCSAVISTTSTAMLETLIANKPVARLDYFNTSPIFPTVWNITHADQIDATVNSLLTPTNEQIFWQEVLKSQVVGYLGNASKRVAELITKMIDFKKSNPTKELPFNMLSDNALQEEKSKLHFNETYPDRKIIQENDTEWLKAKIIRLEWENELLRNEVTKRKIGNFMLNFYHKITKYK